MSTSDRDALAKVIRREFHARECAYLDTQGATCLCDERAESILTSGWLAEHDARVREQAARDALLSAAEEWPTRYSDNRLPASNWLRERAGA